MRFIFRIRPFVRFFFACALGLTGVEMAKFALIMNNPMKATIALAEALAFFLAAGLILRNVGTILRAYFATWR